jgi:hypothetical protein
MRYAASGASFLVCVLWFDLMFDMQAWGYGDAAIPHSVLTSIATYYRRVTIDASPMGQLVAVVMLATLVAVVTEIATKSVPRWLGWTSLALSLSAIGLALVRTLPNAQKLGHGVPDDATASRLASLILQDHVYAIGAMSVVVVLQLASRSSQPSAG